MEEFAQLTEWLRSQIASQSPRFASSGLQEPNSALVRFETLRRVLPAGRIVTQIDRREVIIPRIGPLR